MRNEHAIFSSEGVFWNCKISLKTNKGHEFRIGVSIGQCPIILSMKYVISTKLETMISVCGEDDNYYWVSIHWPPPAWFNNLQGLMISMKYLLKENIHMGKNNVLLHFTPYNHK